MDETTLVLVEIGALLLGMSLLGRIAAMIRISPIPLYLVAGLAFGEGGVLPISAGHDFIEIGAEIGVLLLLVMLGLEYSAGELLGGLKRSFLSGVMDMVINAAPGVALGFLLGWGPLGAMALAGITWISSSGVIARVLHELGRLGNRETPVILSILVIEDLAMAFYLPILTAVLLGMGLQAGIVTVVVALAAVLLILYLALRHGMFISRLLWAKEAESLLLGVLGLTLLVSGLASEVNVSAAVGAFLVGIAISGPVAEHAAELLMPLRDLFAAVFFVFFGLSTDPTDLLPMLLPAAGLAVVSMATKVLSGWLAARKAGIGPAGRWRTGLALTPRGEFSIVIAGLAAGAVAPQLTALATAYVLITIIAGPLLARIPDAEWFKRALRKRAAARAATG